MSKTPKIPEWQRATTESTAPLPSPTVNAPESKVEQLVQAPTPTEDDLSSTEGEESTEETADERGKESLDLLGQARRFLEDPVIRDAPRERKIAFLESKGVRSEDFEALLDVATHQDEPVDLRDAGARAYSTVSCLCSMQIPAFWLSTTLHACMTIY